MTLFADIVLPLAQEAYTFAVGSVADLRVGDAVSVQFGKSSVYTGIVLRLHNNPPKKGKIKHILSRLYDYPLLSPLQLRFWEWIADYYLSTMGEVMRIALPSLIKPHATSQELYEPYKVAQERILRLIREVGDEEFEKITRRAPRRAETIAALKAAGGALPRKAITADAATISALVKAGIIEVFERDAAPAFNPVTQTILPILTKAQSSALESINRAFESCDVALLHGVTSSGKTEIYTHRIAATLAQGKDVLLLVPEISLTTQLVERMERMFPGRVTAYHSKLTATRRTKIYMDMLRKDSGNFIIGARSAIFLPFKALGLVIVDEEHDSSYKQSEPAPRYNGRDAAIMLAWMHRAKTILGSATPSLESYNNAMAGKYAGVWLSERYGESLPPTITVSDTIRAVKRGERKSHFNKELLDKIADRLAAGEQVMLFQNRRGYAPYMECPQCGWTPRCPNCNVTLSSHLSSGTLKCHYCGYSIPNLRYCPECKKSELVSMGFGTEKVEEEISTLFPTARVLRLDGDSASSQGAYERIITDFALHRADILVGTQIIAKGLDFDHVTLIGVLNADNLLNAPDFRAVERAWQTIIQVAGRCGRRDKVGEVVIQTSDTSHPIFTTLSERGYQQFATAQLSERKLFNYPPYRKLIRLTLRHREASRLAEAAKTLGGKLRAHFGSRVLGPVTPLIDRIRGELIVEIVVKIETTISLSKARTDIKQLISTLRQNPDYKAVGVFIDVDPL